MRLFKSTTFWVLAIILGIMYHHIPEGAQYSDYLEWGDRAIAALWAWVAKESLRRGAVAYANQGKHNV